MITGINAPYFVPVKVQQRTTSFDQETFLKLLVVQLTTQNPLEPMNDRDFFAQMAQLGMVQSLGRLQLSLQLGQAASLIGRHVEVLSPVDGRTVEGRVEAVETSRNVVYLRIGGALYEIDRLIRVVGS
ncbi:MAG: flagellar hook capping FlgD N-terminal domain-containing protein [Candidatus Caldarchaeum sp.]